MPQITQIWWPLAEGERCPVASKKMLRGMQKDAPERNCCISFPQPRHIISTHHGIGFWVMGGIFLDSPEHLFELSGASFCSRARVHYFIIVTQKSRKSQKGRPLVAESKVTQIAQMTQILTAFGLRREGHTEITEITERATFGRGRNNFGVPVGAFFCALTGKISNIFGFLLTYSYLCSGLLQYRRIRMSIVNEIQGYEYRKPNSPHLKMG